MFCLEAVHAEGWGGYLGHCGSTWGALRLSTAGGVGGTLLFLVGVLVESLGGGGGVIIYLILLFN